MKNGERVSLQKPQRPYFLFSIPHLRMCSKTYEPEPAGGFNQNLVIHCLRWGHFLLLLCKMNVLVSEAFAGQLTLQIVGENPALVNDAAAADGPRGVDRGAGQRRDAAVACHLRQRVQLKETAQVENRWQQTLKIHQQKIERR